MSGDRKARHSTAPPAGRVMHSANGRASESRKIFRLEQKRSATSAHALSRSRADQLRRLPGGSRLQSVQDREALPNRLSFAGRYSAHQTILIASFSRNHKTK